MPSFETDAFILGEAGEANPLFDTRKFAQRAQDSNRIPSDVGTLPRPEAQRWKEVAQDPFWVDEAIDATRWDKLYPYQLLVLDVQDGVYTKDGLWEFTLPIPPEALTISLPPASTVTATLGGVVEEHNGAPFRLISIRGTTGVLPNRDTAAQDGIAGAANVANTFTGGFFAGTIQAAQGVVTTAAQRLGFAQKNLMDQASLDSGSPGSTGRGTGYYQFHLMRMFIEGYLAMRKRPEGKNKRLAIAMWKDRQVYVVSAGPFEMQRAGATAPLEYMYSWQLKAFRRVQLGDVAPVEYIGQKGDATVLQQILGALANARDVVEGARDVLQAARADVDHSVFEPLRQVSLLLKDAVGVGLTAADLPATIANEGQASFQALFAGFGPGVSMEGGALGSRVDPSALQHSPEGFDLSSLVDAQAVSDSHRSAFSANGAPIHPASQAARMKQLALQTAKRFSEPKSHFSTMARVDIRKAQLTPATRRLIQEELDRVRLLGRADFERFRDTIQATADDFADSIGAGSASYDAIYGRQGRQSSKTPTDTDFQVLFALNQAALEMSRLVIQAPPNVGRVAALEMVAALARRANIPFRVPASKFAVPVPYHTSLEELAARYLGDPNRWHEIASLNGLRAPYVDEEGFELALIANGNGAEVVVATAENLVVGQPITVRAVGQKPTKRRLSRIDQVTTTMVILHLDGDQDLARFTTAGGAKIHAFLPDTINSQQLVYIPSQRPVNPELVVGGLLGISPAEVARGGVDLLLKPNGDAAITQEGDWPYAVGVVNLVQRAKIAFQTRRGQLVQHPTFGLGLRAGVNTGDLDANSMLVSAKGMFGGDTDFAGVQSVKIQKRGSRASVSMNLGVAGTDMPLPVSLDVVQR